jgi:hypothetical protein
LFTCGFLSNLLQQPVLVVAINSAELHLLSAAVHALVEPMASL